MSNDQTRLLSLAIISGFGLVSLCLGQKDAAGVGAIVALVAFIFYIIKYNKMKP
jgi:hypothetical protein